VNTYRIDSLDALFSKYIRYRDKWICQRCRRQFPEKAIGLHCSHYIGRAHKATRWDADNALAACWGCHTVLETHKPTLYREIMEKRLGPARYSALIVASLMMLKATKDYRRAKADWLRGELRAMGVEP
jgi:5-methylcytosine-specific restriction endonuclease McrA